MHTSRSKAELTITGDSESRMIKAAAVGVHHAEVDKDDAGEIGGREGEAEEVAGGGVNGTVAREGAVLQGLDNRAEEAGAADREAEKKKRGRVEEGRHLCVRYGTIWRSS